jgi:hypothetical protein
MIVLEQSAGQLVFSKYTLQQSSISPLPTIYVMGRRPASSSMEATLRMVKLRQVGRRNLSFSAAIHAACWRLIVVK